MSMPSKLLKTLSKKQQTELLEALHYLKMGELKKLCDRYQLPTTGKKAAIIQRLMHYWLTGKVLQSIPLPSVAKAKPYTIYPLHPDTLILHGNYKNDLKTRQFFQQLIGKHFHFTAFGLDWIQNRWLQGKPPTYAEFARMWQREYKHRQNNAAQPKQEWAYLSFLQRYQKQHPTATRREMSAAWEKTREMYVAKVQKVLEMQKSCQNSLEMSPVLTQ
jgi:hypothetical protein